MQYFEGNRKSLQGKSVAREPVQARLVHMLRAHGRQQLASSSRAIHACCSAGQPAGALQGKATLQHARAPFGNAVQCMRMSSAAQGKQPCIRSHCGKPRSRGKEGSSVGGRVSRELMPCQAAAARRSSSLAVHRRHKDNKSTANNGDQAISYARPSCGHDFAWGLPPCMRLL